MWFDAWNCCIKTINNSQWNHFTVVKLMSNKCFDSDSDRQTRERWFSIIRLRRVSGDKVTLDCLIVTKVQYLNQTSKMADELNQRLKYWTAVEESRPFVASKISPLSPLVTSLSYDARRIRFPDLSLSCTIYTVTKERSSILLAKRHLWFGVVVKASVVIISNFSILMSCL